MATRRTLPRDKSLPGLARFRSVLVPTDLTPSSDRALARLRLLPLGDGGRVTILHVVPGSLPRGQQREAERDAEAALEAEARHLRGALPDDVTVQTLVATGPSFKEIGTQARKVKAELIVMGRGGGRALRDTFLGSTAERVIRHSKLPVLVVRLPPRAAYRRPSLALDLDRAANEVIRLMLRVLPPPWPGVAVIHAYDIPYGSFIYPSLARGHSEDSKNEFHIEATRALERFLGAALAKMNVSPEHTAFWRMHVRYGSPRLVVEKAIEKADTDLLVVGTRARSGAAYALLGTVAGDLLRVAKCDVLVVPPGARSRPVHR